MIETFSFFDADGRVLPTQYIGPADQLAGQVLPAGAQPIAGLLSPERHRVELITGDFGDAVPVVRDFVPPAPEADEWRTWAWDAGLWQWQAVPTLAARKRDAVAAVDAQIAAIEGDPARATREALLVIAAALAAGAPPPADVVERLAAVEAAIVPLRAARALIAAAATEGELAAAVPNSP